MLLGLLRGLFQRVRAEPALPPVAHAAVPGRILRDDPGSPTFVLQSDFGPLVVSRRDNMIGRSVLETGSWERAEVDLLQFVMQARDPRDAEVEILDVGANVGVHTIGFARFPFARLTVHAFEAQRAMHAMLLETIALNALTNVRAHHCAVSDRSGEPLSFPAVDYDFESNFGALELEPAVRMDFDGRRVPGRIESVITLRIDDLGLQHVRLLKADVEGMEIKVLAGARKTIERCRPILFVEVLKVDFAALKALLGSLGYVAYDAQHPNILAVPEEMKEVRFHGARPV